MASEQVSAKESAFLEARAMDAPLSMRLAHVADFLREANPQSAAVVDGFVARLAAAGAGVNAPRIGDIMPDFMLPDQDGRLVSLEELREKAPVVLVFHRGHWCPYCRLTMAGLAAIEARVAPFGLVGISPERQPFTRALRHEADAGFPFLTDLESGYALSVNLAIWIDDVLASLIGRAGSDIPGYNGSLGWILPIPAIFVVDRDGTIVARHVDPDYRRRMELEDIVAALDAVRR